MLTPTQPTLAIPAADLEDILARTEGLWEEVRGQRLFVTGGTGFFGKWLIGSLLHINRRLDLKAQVWVLTRQSGPMEEIEGLTWVHGDGRDFVFPTGSFSHIVHAAATSAVATFSGEPPLAKVDNVVGGTRRVLEFAAACGARKFLLTSSGSAYGPMPAGRQAFNEDDLGAPDLADPIGSALGESKRMAELLVRAYANSCGFDAKIARCFSFIGPYLPLDLHYAIGNFIRDALAGGPVVVTGDGSPIRSWLYMTDLIVWLWTLLFRGTSNRMYNVGSDEAVPIAEAARRVASLTGTKVRFLGTRAAAPTASTSIYVPEVRRIDTELGLRRMIPLDEAIDRTVSFYRGVRSGQHSEVGAGQC
jgi:nucleoside-diphosphate-sugar epimerase